MADQSIIKRPVVFTSAYLQRYPTLDDRYAATLPMSSTIPCKCYDWHQHHWNKNCKGNFTAHKFPAWTPALKARCIKRTGERWTWFSAARRLDDERGERLGTLGHLNWDIRQEIIKALFCDEDWYSHEAFISETNKFGDIYRFVFPHHRSICYGMRLASPSTKVEFEHYFFTKTNFICTSSEELENFLDWLSVYQQSLLRSLTVQCVYSWGSCSDISSWIAVCARLPPNLTSIQFELSWYGINTETSEKSFILDDDCPVISQVVADLETLGKRTRRCVPKAKIGLRIILDEDEDEDPDPLWETAIKLLHELKPGSKNWRTWWEEVTKVDLDGGERANNGA